MDNTQKELLELIQDTIDQIAIVSVANLAKGDLLEMKAPISLEAFKYHIDGQQKHIQIALNKLNKCSSILSKNKI